MKEQFIPIRRGILDHLLRGAISYSELGVYVMIHLQADYSTGIWSGSAARITSTAPRGADIRKVQRAIEHLTELGLLKVFHTQGVRGNYPVLINKYTVRSGALTGRRLNATATTDWRFPVYEPCAVDDGETAAVSAAVDAPSQEIRKKIRIQTPSSEAALTSDLVSGPPPGKTPPSEAGLRLARLLRDRILGNNAAAKITPQQVIDWARKADLLIRCDGRTESEISGLIEWSQKDSFWLANILSMGKLREKFDQLTVKKQNPGNGTSNGTGQRDRRASAAVPAEPNKSYGRQRTLTTS